MSLTRLDKYIADSGTAPRSKVKKAIKSGKVTVDGKIIKDSGYKTDTENSTVAYCGKTISYDRLVYIMLNKPKGVVSSTDDKRDKTVIDLLDADLQNRKLFPVGRLDKDTTGLLILTNDGDFAHRTLSPSRHINKVYTAELDKKPPENTADLFLKGIDIGGHICGSSIVEYGINANGVPSAKITISEGKYHQVKRMFEAVGCKVTELKRIKFGEIALDDSLPLGGSRPLNRDEMKYVNKILNGTPI